MENTKIPAEHPGLNAHNEELSPEDLGLGIRALRKKIRLSAREVADRIDVQYQNYIYYERRCSATIWDRHKHDIARVLEVTPDEIIWAAVALKNSPEESAPDVDPAASLEDDIESLELARKAKARRRALKLSAASVATQIGVSTMTLSSWEKVFPKALSRERAQSWADALNAPTDWLLDVGMALPSEGVDVEIVLSSAKSRTVSDELMDIAAWLCTTSKLERVAKWAALSPNDRKNARLFCMRYGIAGDLKTLENVGQAQGVKKERVRQVCSRMLERARSQAFITPALDRLVEEMYPVLPAPMDVLEHQFRRLLGEKQSLKGALEFSMEVLGRRLFSVQRSNVGSHEGDLLTVTRLGEDAPHLREVFEVSKRMIRSVGAAQIHMVFGMYATENPGLAYSEFAHFVKTLPGFEWLSESAGWYWLGPETPTENRIIRAALKIASVAAQRVDVEAVLAAIDRSRRGNTSSNDERPDIDVDAPRQIVLQVLIQSGRFELCQYDDVAPIEETSPESILSDTEMSIYRTLKARGGVASWTAIKERICTDEGVSTKTMDVALRRSAIFEHLDFGLYRLIGHSLATTEAIESINEWRGMHEPQAPLGARADQVEPVYFDLEIRSAILDSGNLDLPPHLVPYVVETAPYAIEHSHHAVMIRSSKKHGHLRGDALVRAMIDKGYAAGEEVRIFLFPRQRQFCIERKISVKGLPAPDRGGVANSRAST